MLGHVGEDRCAFEADGVKRFWVKAEGLEDSGGDLRCLCGGGDRARGEGRVGEEHDDVGVIVREATVLGELLGAAGVDDAGVGSDDDVRGAWVTVGRETGGLVVEGEGGAVEDGAEADGGAVLLERRYGGGCVSCVFEPEKGDVVLGCPDAAAGGRFRGGKKAGDDCSNVARWPSQSLVR